MEPVDNKLLSRLFSIDDLYENAPCGYFSFLPDGTIIKINKTLLSWLGYTEDEVLFKLRFVDLITKGGVIYYEMFYLALLKMQGRVNEINYDLIRKDGSFFPALVNSVLISNFVEDHSGPQAAVNATVVDITDRKKYEQELLLAKNEAEAEKKRFEFLADLIPEIVWTATPQGEIDYVNQRFFQYFSLNEKQPSSADILSKVHVEDQRKCIRSWVNSVKTGKDFHCQVRLEEKSGGIQWHLLRAMAYKDDQGKLSKWFGSCTNIDEHVLALQRKDEFINVASHELKTPLTSLKAYNQLLLRIEDSPKTRLFAEKSSTALNNLQFLVTSLLDVSLINSDQLSLHLSTLSVEEIVQQSIDLVRLNYPSHEIIKEPAGDENIFINADKQRLTQVIVNLLNNAVKYSPEADKVLLSVKKDDGRNSVTIQVTDFGIGIPEDKLEFIFDKYYRVSETKNNNRVSGLGLGLYIIKNILKLHGSIINVESVEDKGSTFSFSLPIVKS